MKVRIPGEPRPHGRPRASKRGAFIKMRTDDKDLDWRGRAQVHMLEAVSITCWWDLPSDVADGQVPLRVDILAVFTCPKTDHRKRTPRPRRWHTKRGDTDNIAKAVLDAGNGVLWLDDAQVAELRVTKLIGAQGEAPFVELTVTPLDGAPPQGETP